LIGSAYNSLIHCIIKSEIRFYFIENIEKECKIKDKESSF